MKLTRRSKAWLAVGAGLGMLALAGCGPAAAPTSAAPQAAGFPTQWLQYGYNQEHNTVFPGTGAASGVLQGISWRFREHRGIPLNQPPRDESVLGKGPSGYFHASVKTTQDLGNAVGVTAVGGIIYVGEDRNRVYAINALTGKKLWESMTINQNMAEPIVADGLVIVDSGDTGFSYSNVMKFAKHQPIVRGMGFAGVWAFNAQTGKKVWSYDTKGEVMPDGVVLGNAYIFGNGDGHVYALNLKTGKPLWITAVAPGKGGFDSMSSANWWKNPATGQTLVYVGFSDPNFVYALDAATGKVVWKQTVPKVFSTGMGDNSPVVDPTAGIVLDDSVVSFNAANKTLNLDLYAMNAATGQILWQHKLGRGKAILAFKAGLIMVHHGVAYVGDPDNGTLQAYAVKTGAKLWETTLPKSKIAGQMVLTQDRGSPVYYKGVLYEAAGSDVFALNPKTGTILASYPVGGRFGMINPVIVGGTMYLANSWGWTLAIPLHDIYPKG